ncbi:ADENOSYLMETHIONINE-8-AMINO-7-OXONONANOATE AMINOTRANSFERASE [Salix purpurea]|uniref:ADENOSYLMETHIONINE-8-AMINO-7-OXONONANOATE AMINOTRANSFERASE n=1 Tax=Salix purpurea TaxID=77065 RepID=A0A9Q0T307_SALPP|nr:ADENOSYLMETHIONINE-8-AMINO-7-OXONONANOATE AMINOTRANSFERASE [Salix purpurea]
MLFLRHRSCRHHSLLRIHIKFLSTTSSQPLHLPLSFPTYMIWGSNTSLGKTLISTGLSSSFLLSPLTTKKPHKFVYLKPIQTVPSLGTILRPRIGILGFYNLNFREENRFVKDGVNVVSELVCETLYAWKEAVSPHLAAEKENGVVEDSLVLETLEKCLRKEEDIKEEEMDVFCVVETAGGVASPGPSGTLQCDLYRPFRLPGVLMGDGRLGGISGTISAYESLKLRGYDIVAVVLEDHGLVNEVPLLSYLRNRVPVIVLPPVPKDMSNDLVDWFGDSDEAFNSLKEIMISAFSERILRLNDMAKKAGNTFWWPFTQHKLVPEEAVTVIDSRCGENFAIYKGQDNQFITQQFDGCASWWTQGPDATLQIELAREMGYTAARYGHVMFPENVYEPALECAELLLEGVGKGWASRTYYSDNGSTAIEIALKMAFRKFSFDNGLLSDFPNNTRTDKSVQLKVLALKGSYHGDTLGAMEAQAPSSYTGFLQQPWYTGRGLFLDPPTVSLSNNKWNLSLPEGMHCKNMIKKGMSFSTRDKIFDKSRDKSDLTGVYSSYISQKLLQYPGLKESIHVGALIIEPVIQGAGGMLMIDPLFQRVLVSECRSRNIPVIFDEVFTGFWRLGTESAAELLGCLPDIACFAKLMTGGVIPLAATLATDAVFDSFLGESKLKALLHGHSYTAHAMGCSAAAKSIKWLKDPQTNHNIISGQRLLREVCTIHCFCLLIAYQFPKVDVRTVSTIWNI